MSSEKRDMASLVRAAVFELDGEAAFVLLDALEEAGDPRWESYNYLLGEVILGRYDGVRQFKDAIKNLFWRELMGEKAGQELVGAIKMLTSEAVEKREADVAREERRRSLAAGIILPRNTAVPPTIGQLLSTPIRPSNLDGWQG